MECSSNTFVQSYCSIVLMGFHSKTNNSVLLHKNYSLEFVLLCIPLLANHRGICEDAGLENIVEYRYYKKETRGLDIEGMIADIKVLNYNNCAC